MIRLRFLGHAVLDLVGVFVLTGTLVWAAVAAFTLGPARAQVCFAVLVAKLLPLPGGLGLMLPCWLPAGVTWVMIRTLQGQSLPLLFYAAGVVGVGVGVIAVKKTRQWFLRVGAEAAEPQFLRGAKVVTPEELNAVISNPGPFLIGDEVQMPEDAEKQGLLIVGSTGTGKSQYGLQFLAQLREDT